MSEKTPTVNSDSHAKPDAGDDEPRSFGSVTRLLVDCAENPVAWAKLWARIREEVRRIYVKAVGVRMKCDPMDDPRFADALSNIFLKRRSWKSRSAFFAFLFKVLRNIDRSESRKQRTTKRGGGAMPVSFEEGMMATAPRRPTGNQDLIEGIREILQRFQREHPSAHRVLERKEDGGSWEKIAADVDMPIAEAKARWEFCRSWIRSEVERMELDK